MYSQKSLLLLLPRVCDDVSIGSPVPVPLDADKALEVSAFGSGSSQNRPQGSLQLDDQSTFKTSWHGPAAVLCTREYATPTDHGNQQAEPDGSKPLDELLWQKHTCMFFNRFALWIASDCLAKAQMNHSPA